MSKTKELHEPETNRRRTHSLRRYLLLLLMVLVVFLGVGWLAIRYDWLNHQSSDFDLERFRAIEIGSDIGDAIEVLGPPLEVQEASSIRPGEDKIYLFMGNPPDWWPFVTEAGFITDEDGRILSRFLNREP